MGFWKNLFNLMFWPLTPFPGTKTPEIPAFTPPPSIEDPEIKEAAAREAERIRKKKGLRSTILTGSQGLLTPPPVLKEKLGD